jgi:hypothetical protein
MRVAAHRTMTVAGSVAAGVIASAFLAAGCGDDSAGPDPPGGLTEPDQVLDAVAVAWEQKDLASLDGLLSSDFKFYVRDDEQGDFPWMTNPWWTRSDELSCAGNMFDANFTGNELPVQSIEFELTVLSESELQPGTHELIVDAVILVLTGPADGWSSNTRFVLELTEQPEGFLLLSRMTEVLKLEPARGESASLQEFSWGRMKALYRGIPVELTDPPAVVRSLAQAWEEKNGYALGALLAPDFAFFIRGDQAHYFPWLTGPSWDRDTELGFAANMFDPAFVGAVPPVQSIQFDHLLLASSLVAPGEHELTTDAVVTVLTGPGNGWSADTRFVFRISEQPDGFLRVREMREVWRLEPGRAGASAPTSWAVVKDLYR